MRPEILFYSDFPFGYHNPEAEEKMARFSKRGYRVIYVEQLGIKNPGMRRLGGAIRARMLAPSRDDEAAFSVVSPKLLPPRRAPLLRGLNGRWLKRQLTAPLEDPAAAIVWIRYPTPELLPFLREVSPALVVYEAVDDHPGSRGIDERLRKLLVETERRILDRAAVVFAWSEPIFDRLSTLHPNVILASAATDVEALATAGEAEPRERRAVYLGSADFRIDPDLLVAVAAALTDWSVAVAGPVEAPVEAVLRGTTNIELCGRVAAADVPQTLASASVCLMPYRRNEFNENLTPIKLVEYLATGRPVVSTSIRAAREFADVVEIADDPAAFAAAVRAAAATDDPAARAKRRERAKPYSWDALIDQMEAAIEKARSV